LTYTTEARTPIKQALIEPLSERELDVLRVLASDLDAPDIGREPDSAFEHHANAHEQHLHEARVNNRRAAVLGAQ
jgi:LuxR family maltose regulon positive regulatory protein